MFRYPKEYDVIVIGAGHAGVEAALVSARLGGATLLLTLNADSIGQMSCNPAIGGSAKGQLVREIDALGGEMGINTDFTGIQFRMLNTKRGPAVHAPRAQCDKKAYQFRLKWICEKQDGLDVKQGQVESLVFDQGKVAGVRTTLGVEFSTRTVVVTTGTFLHGLMHIGTQKQSGGRAGDAATSGISQSLSSIGMNLGRLKTGTPPRVLRKSINLEQMILQLGDDPVHYFTFWKDELFHMEHGAGRFPAGSILARHGSQLPCYLTRTTEHTASLIRKNLHKSPMYSGVIEGTGPRYCPSIEDKIVKFPDKSSHQIFFEPEGIATDEMYVNGLSTCLPYDVQIDLVRSLEGCANAEILRPAYAVEYDFVYPTQLYPSLETKVCENLFLAGQINGTSGYEEAAAQGLMAGINAIRKLQGKAALVLRRDQAYVGVLIDDLVTKGTIEPYRMFSSRAEYRLLLRQDNADLRLCDIGNKMRSLSNARYKTFCEKRRAVQQELARLETTRFGTLRLAQLLRRPEVRYKDLPNADLNLPTDVVQQVEIEVKYSGYLERQEVEVEKAKTFERKQIPSTFDYDTVPSLRIEARQKLKSVRPGTIGQASRISGVSPADIAILLVWLKRGSASQEIAKDTCASEPECCDS